MGVQNETKYLNLIEERLLEGSKPFELRTDALALIIGLGGTGINYAAKTKELLLKRYGAQDVQERVKFLCLDTDKTNIPPLFTEHEFIPINGFDRTNEWINGWLNADLNPEDFGSGGNGAAGIRMCGRWQLFSSEPVIIKQLKETMQDFASRMGVGGINKIYVVVTSSICGGTGCGTFIDVPYFVRKAMALIRLEEKFVEFYGMLELPDSKISSSKGMSEPDKARCYANAFSALKELNYFMGMGKDVEYKAKFSGSEELFISRQRIFTQCFLLSNWTMEMNGGRPYNRNPLAENAHMTYLDGAIPEAVNIILSKQREETEQGEVKYFGFDSAMSNVNGQGFYPGEKFFATFGVSKIEIPLPEIILAIFNRLFLGLSQRWNLLGDVELKNKVIQYQILPVFNLRALLTKLTDEILEIPDIGESDLKDKDFFKDMQTRLNSAAFSPVMNRANTIFTQKLDETIDKIYKTYGPFFTLKVLEEDEYGTHLDDVLNTIKIELASVQKNASQIKADIEKYNNFGTFLGFKQKAKDEMLESIKKSLAAQEGVVLALEAIIKKRREILEKDFREKYFYRVTKMVKELTVILKQTTGIETYAVEESDDNATVFSWDFSGVPYETIDKRIDYLFTKKITIKHKGSTTLDVRYVKGSVRKFEGGQEKEEIFFLPEQKQAISIKTNEGQIDDVVSVEEVLQFNTSKTDTVNIEEELKKFLDKVKVTPEGNIFNLMLESFSGIIEAFTKETFVDFLVMYSPVRDFSRSFAGFSTADKKKCFQKAIEKFKTFALPSFPVVSDKINEQLNTRRFSVVLQPEFEKEYEQIIDGVRDQIVSKHDTQTIPRKKISMMISVNFYFDYPLDWYNYINDCKKEYEKYKQMGKSLHLAEGKDEDWRPLLKDIV